MTFTNLIELFLKLSTRKNHTYVRFEIVNDLNQKVIFKSKSEFFYLNFELIDPNSIKSWKRK
jgi:hypothetical protein